MIVISLKVALRKVDSFVGPHLPMAPADDYKNNIDNDVYNHN